MHSRHICSAALVAMNSACATAIPVDPSPAPANDPAAMAIAAANPTRWTGSFQPTLAHTGSAVVTDRQKAYGTVELTIPPARPTRTYVRLAVSAPANSNVNTLRWGVFAGRCGSGAPAVIPADGFPRIELTNGRGSIEEEIGFEMPAEGEFHVNVLHGSGTQLSNVLTCANLRRLK